MSSFNIKISPSYINRLKSTSDRGVKIRILYGISIDPETLKSLRSIENAEVAQLNNLHAKLFINETKCIVGSMNFSEASERNENHECAVLIDKQLEPELYQECYEEFLEFLKISQKINNLSPNLFEGKIERSTNHKTTEKSGHCIRCHKSITLDPDRPFCRLCFSVWAEWENPFYEEEFCHRCGKYSETSMDSPLCTKCTWKSSVPFLDKLF